MIHVILKWPLDLAAAVILVSNGSRVPRWIKDDFTVFQVRKLFLRLLYLVFSFHSFFNPLCLSVCLFFCWLLRQLSQVSLCHWGAASAEVINRVWHASKDNSCLHLKTSCFILLWCNYMDVKVELVGFTTRPMCCVSQGSNVLSQTPSVDIQTVLYPFSLF